MQVQKKHFQVLAERGFDLAEGGSIEPVEPPGYRHGVRIFVGYRGSGRVNVSPGRVGSGPRKVTRKQLCSNPRQHEHCLYYRELHGRQETDIMEWKNK